MIRASAILLIGLLAAIRPANAECDTTLKQTDGFRELSAKLKCLNDAIEALKSDRSADRPPPALKRPASARAQEVMDGKLRIELTKCGVSQRGNVQCEFSLTNLTKEDRQVCFGLNSRLVTEAGQSFSQATGLQGKVGSVESRFDNHVACDAIPPLSRSAAVLWFIGSSVAAAQGNIQFLRLDCGPGCLYEAYDISLS